MGKPSIKLATPRENKLAGAVAELAERPITIDEWRRDARETFRVALGAYKGCATIDMRVWYSDGAGSLKPARHGLTLSIARLPRLASALSEAMSEAREQGLIAPDADSGDKAGDAR